MENNTKWPRAILLGQFIAMLSATSNAASFTLVNSFGFQAPFFLLFLLYTLLSLHFFRRLSDDTNHFDEKPLASSFPEPDENESLRRISATSTKRRLSRFCCLNLKCPLYMYFLISLLDVMPNFFVLLALQYTSLTSVTLLLGSLAVPSTMFFSSRRMLLSRYFTGKHYMGVCLCVLGGMLAVGLDCSNPSSNTTGIPTTASTTTTTTLHFADSATDSFFNLNVGDLLMCTAALLYGLGDTVAEYFVKHLDRNEYLGMLGIFGMVQTSFLFPLLEHDALNSAWATMMQPPPLLYQPDGGELRVIVQSGLMANGPINNNGKWLMFATLVWFVGCQYLYYVMEVHFLATSDATLLNLSMQAANLWAIIFSVVVANPQQQLLRHVPPPLFYVALVLVVSGVVLYEMDGTKVMTQQEQHLQEKLQKQHCPRHYIIGIDDDDDESRCHNDHDLSGSKALSTETIRYSDYQSCRIKVQDRG